MPSLRVLPTPAVQVCDATVHVLREALARAEAGETVSVVIIEDVGDRYLHTWSPSLDRVRRIGLLTVALHEIVSDRRADDAESG